MRVNQFLIWAPLFLILSLTIPLVTEAQLYRYKDANDNWCYTDNLADVPVNQREDCKEYESIQSSDEQPSVVSKAKDDKNVDLSSEEEVQTKRLRDELKNRKVSLDQEYEALVKESSVLEKLSQNLKTEEAKKSFEIRKDEFNRRVKAFEEKRQAFEIDLKSYNDIIGYKKTDL
jgi:hypothetical protein